VKTGQTNTVRQRGADVILAIRDRQVASASASCRRLAVLGQPSEEWQLTWWRTTGKSGVRNIVADRMVELEKTTNRCRRESRAHNFELAATAWADVSGFRKCFLEEL